MADSDSKNPIDTMVQRIRDAQADLDQASVRLHAAATALYAHVRKQPANDYTSSYLTLAQASTRLAGAVSQGVKRASSTHRHVATSIQRTREEDQRKEQRKADQLRKADQVREKRAKKLIDSGMDEELLSLYGDDR